MTAEAAPSQTPSTPPATPSTGPTKTSTPTPTPSAPSTGPKKAADFRMAANDVDRTDIGGKFHIVGSGFGEQVGSVTVNEREAHISLSNKDHKPMWDDENIFGQLPPMSVSGIVVVTTHDGKKQYGRLTLNDRRIGSDPKADVTDDVAHHPNA